jgi:hypothetical protein
VIDHCKGQATAVPRSVELARKASSRPELGKDDLPSTKSCMAEYMADCTGSKTSCYSKWHKTCTGSSGQADRVQLVMQTVDSPTRVSTLRGSFATSAEASGRPGSSGAGPTSVILRRGHPATVSDCRGPLLALPPHPLPPHPPGHAVPSLDPAFIFELARPPTIELGKPRETFPDRTPRCGLEAAVLHAQVCQLNPSPRRRGSSASTPSVQERTRRTDTTSCSHRPSTNICGSPR